MSTTTFLLLIIHIIVSFVLSKDYSNCQWFGNKTNVPLYPIGVCSAHSHETELQSLSLYSTKMECNNGELTQFEWNNTLCDGNAYHSQTYRKEDGYHFNCDTDTLCPYAKIILWELRDSGPGNLSHIINHNDHICSYDTKAFHEISIVTNLCIDLLDEYNTSFYIDCNSQKVSYEEFNDAQCQTKIKGNAYFEISEGCDDPLDINAYVQIAQCNDATATTGESAAYHHHDIAIIFSIVVAVIIIILVIMIVGVFIRRKGESQLNSVNFPQTEIFQPFNVDFQSIVDETEATEAAEPQSTQHITTQGQDIQEIPIISDPSHYMR